MCEDKKLLTKGISSNCNSKTKWQSVERGGKEEHTWKAQLMRVELRQVTERMLLLANGYMPGTPRRIF